MAVYIAPSRSQLVIMNIFISPSDSKQETSEHELAH